MLFEVRLILLLCKGTGKLVGFLFFIVFVAYDQLPPLTPKSLPEEATTI